MKRVPVVFEDTTMAYNRWVQGIASREISASSIPLSKVLNDTQREQDPNFKQNNKSIHPILDKTPEIVGQVIMSLSNLKQKVKLALQSDLAHNLKKKESLKKTLRLINRELRIVQIIVKEFENL